MTAPHPAKFTSSIMESISHYIEPGWVVLDPFAGVGGIFELEQMGLGVACIGIEIEPEWKSDHPRHYVGDFFDYAEKLINGGVTFDAIVTSPVYGNRMSDHHDARDGSKRHTYKHYLGRDLHPNNSGQLQWGTEYKAFHEKAWLECAHLLDEGGLLVLNIKDHIRKGDVQRVSKWHTETILEYGFDIVAMETVNAPGLRHGKNYEAREALEFIRVFQKVERV
jgi:tRNA G10  N-methylase Trm11